MSVAPHVGAWIEIVEVERRQTRSMSHPTWVRGLKFEHLPEPLDLAGSHPTWVRGLKFQSPEHINGRTSVAPHVGAWIEIL